MNENFMEVADEVLVEVAPRHGKNGAGMRKEAEAAVWRVMLGNDVGKEALARFIAQR